MRKICQHCKVAMVNRPRGLCWSCYYKPGVRELYPSTSKYARRGEGNQVAEPPLPDAPTQALPGTPEKIAVLAERVRRKQALWHPDDATGLPASVATERPTRPGRPTTATERPTRPGRPSRVTETTKQAGRPSRVTETTKRANRDDRPGRPSGPAGGRQGQRPVSGSPAVAADTPASRGSRPR